MWRRRPSYRRQCCGGSEDPASIPRRGRRCIHQPRDRPTQDRPSRASAGLWSLRRTTGGAKPSWEAHIAWDMRCLQASGFVRPFLWQVERPVDEGMAMPRHIGGEHSDLAIGDLARRASVLACNHARGLALFQKAGLIGAQSVKLQQKQLLTSAPSPTLVPLDRTRVDPALVANRHARQGQRDCAWKSGLGQPGMARLSSSERPARPSL